MLARGSRPPGCAEASAADVVAGSVIETVAWLAAVLAVPVLLARFMRAEAGKTVRQQVRIASTRLLLTIPLGEEPTLVRGCFGWLCKSVGFYGAMGK